MRDTRKISGKLPIVIIIIVLVVCMGAGAFVFMAKGKKASAAGGKKEKEKHVELSEWKFDEFVVNLADQSESHYLKVSITMEVESLAEGGKKKGGGGHGGGEAGNPEDAKARDAIITALTRKRYSELLSEDGKTALKKEMKEALNESLEESEIHNIYFTSFAMQ